MPSLAPAPRYQLSVGLPVVPLARGSLEAAGAAGAATQRGAMGVIQATGERMEFDERRRQFRERVNLMKANTAAEEELGGASAAIEQEKDFLTGLDRYDKAAEAALKKTSAVLTDKDTRALFEAHFAERMKAGRATLKTRLFKAEADDADAGLVRAEDVMARAYANAPNDVARRNIVAAQAENYSGMVEAGYLDKSQTEKRFLAWRERGDRTIVQNRLNNAKSPEETLQILDDMRGGRYANLTPASIEPLARQTEEQARRQADAKVRAEDKAERLSRRAAEEEGDGLLKQIYETRRKGEPIDTLIARARLHPGVKPAEYAGLLELQGRTDPRDDDPSTLADIVPRLDREDVTADLTRALRAGKIKGETYTSLAGRNRAALKDDQPASPYKSGRELVNLSLKPPEVLGAGAAQDAARFAQAEALAEFDAWFDANRSSDRATSMTEARNVVQRYQAIQFERMSIGMGLPRHVRGTRSELTSEQLDAAETLTVQQADKGLMSKEQAAGEIRKIEAWREILSRRPVKKAEAPKK